MSQRSTDHGAGVSRWLSLVADQEVDAPELQTVEDIIAFRSHPSRDLRRHNVELPENVTVHKTVLGQLDGLDVNAEVYVPDGDGPFPLVQYMHGGGWCLGSAEYVRKLGMSISSRGHVVVNVDYALAPEQPFPTAMRQCVYAARWAVAHGDEFKGDGGRLAIGGASAGANLAAATIVALTADQAPPEVAGAGEPVDVEFSGVFLLYGVLNFPLIMEKPGDFSGGWTETVFNLAYLGPHWHLQHRNPLVSPALAEHLDRFPPAYLVNGDEDTLLPQSLDMTERLVDAGVSTTLSVPTGLNHSFAYIPHLLPAAAEELERMFRWIEATTRAAERQDVAT
jgi:acetyl esterase